MASTGKDRKNTAEILGDILKDFGDTVSEALEDPELSVKAKEFAKAVAEAAMKATEKKIKNEEVRSKLRNVVKAARMLGEQLEKRFDNAKAD